MNDGICAGITGLLLLRQHIDFRINIVQVLVDGIHPAPPSTKVINRRIGSACEHFAQWRHCGASGNSSGELQVHPRSPGFDIARRVLPPTTLGRGADRLGLGLLAHIIKTAESATAEWLSVCVFFVFRSFCFCNRALSDGQSNQNMLRHALFWHGIMIKHQLILIYA